jgi:hypothetical protein
MVTKAGWLALFLYLPDFGQACFKPARCCAAHVHGRTEATKPVLVPDKRTALRRGCVSAGLSRHNDLSDEHGPADASASNLKYKTPVIAGDVN